MKFTLLSLMLAAAPAMADNIGMTQITPSTTMGQYWYFSLNQLNDGISADSPWNGYASGFGVVSGRITLALDQAYDLSSFVLWNDINILNEGVRSFKLVFENASGDTLGSTGTYTALSQFAPQVYTFDNLVSGVKTVQLDVLTSNLQIEIRELAFNGSATVPVPEPETYALILAGLGLVGFVARRRT